MQFHLDSGAESRSLFLHYSFRNVHDTCVVSQLSRHPIIQQNPDFLCHFSLPNHVTFINAQSEDSSSNESSPVRRALPKIA